MRSRCVSPSKQTGTSPFPRRRSIGSVFVGAGIIVALAGCNAVSLTQSEPTAGSTLAPLGVDTTIAPGTAAASDTAASDPPGGSDPAGESTSNSTSAPAATQAPTTPPGGTLPVYQEELVLSNEGIGTRTFGAPTDDVVGYISSLLGSPTSDTGWVETAQFPDCPGTEVRIVDYGVLSLQFTDDSPVEAEGQHFSGWTYGSVVEIGQSPDGLVTNVGVGLGSPLSEVLAAYPGAVVSEGDPDTAFPDSFSVDNDVWGLLSGPTPDDVVTRLSSGYGCGS